MKTNATRPSFLGAVLLTLIAFMFSALAIGLFADTYISEVTGEGESFYAAREHRSSIVTAIGLCGGVLVALFAGVAWRAPVSLRFHLTFFAGLALLASTCAYVLGQRSLAFAAAYRGDSSNPFLTAPLVAPLLTCVALILLVTALYLDRP